MKFFSLENPVWKFIGNLADFFILSCLWYLCSLPVVTAGAAASAVYYVTLKMSRDQEGELVRSFFKSFRQNLKPGCLLGVGYLAAAVVLLSLIQISQPPRRAPLLYAVFCFEKKNKAVFLMKQTNQYDTS